MEDLEPWLEKLPTIAFATSPETGETIAILRGEPMVYRVGTEKTAAQLNAMYGVRPAQQQAMLAGVTHGWHTPFADPARYDTHGRLRAESGTGRGIPS
jgi:hypothetical protein